MAVTSQNGVLREVLTTFLGVNLRRDSLSLADEEVMRAINADLHTQPGVIRLRPGRSLHNGANLGAEVRTLAFHTPRRYQVAGGALYRNYSSILTGLDTSTLVTTLAAYRPLNDTTTWSFIADQALMRKDDGTNVRIWGIVAPSATPVIATGAAGALTGNYSAVYTYARVVSGAVAHESNPCPTPAAIALTAQQLNIPVVASGDPQVTNIRIYRTVAGGTELLFDQQVSNANATISSTQADSALGTAVETDNETPPLAGWVVEFQGSLFLCLDASNPHYLWYSKRFRPESVPSEQFLELGNPTDPLQSAVALTGLLGVFSRETKYRVVGNTLSGFVAQQALSTRGIAAPNAFADTGQGVVFCAHDGLFLTNFADQDVELTQNIQALFYGETVNDMVPIDWDQPDALTLEAYRRRLYFGYRDTNDEQRMAVYSLDTKHWYFYTHPAYRLLYEEIPNQLLMGDQGGQVWVLDDGTTDNGDAVTLNVDFPKRAMGDRFAQKGFGWIAIESAGTGTWSIELLVDDTVITTKYVTGTRQKRYLPLPDGTGGQTWQAKVAYTGSDTAALYGVELRGTDTSLGQVWVEHPTVDSQYVALLPGAPRPLQAHRRRFDFLTLDADAGDTGGVWLVRLYVDGSLVATVNVVGQANKRLYPLPAEILGFQWHAIARYQSTGESPALYGVGVLDTGVGDGQVWVQSPTHGAQQYVDILPATALLNRTTWQQFRAVQLDAEASAGTWTAEVYIDGVLVETLPNLYGDRQRRLTLLSQVYEGYAWHLRTRYDREPSPQVLAGAVVDTGAPDGQLWILEPGFPQHVLEVRPVATLNPLGLARWAYLKFDAENPGATWTVEVYIDGQRRHTARITRARQSTLLRLPPGLIGATWHLRATYTSMPPPKVYAAQVYGQPLQPGGAA